MSEMSYVRRSDKSLAETVEALQSSATEANWTVLAVHDMKSRFESKGHKLDCGLTPVGFTGGVTGIVDAVVL